MVAEAESSKIPTSAAGRQTWSGPARGGAPAAAPWLGRQQNPVMSRAPAMSEPLLLGAAAATIQAEPAAGPPQPEAGAGPRQAGLSALPSV